MYGWYQLYAIVLPARFKLCKIAIDTIQVQKCTPPYFT